MHPSPAQLKKCSADCRRRCREGHHGALIAYRVGVKVSHRQLAPAATTVPQLLVCLKSAAFGPLTAMLLRLRLALPVSRKVTVEAELAVCIC